MNRIVSIALAPEVLLAGFTALVFAVRARHGSYGSDDVRVLERMMWLLPFVAVPLAFGAWWLAESRTWFGLARINLALLASLVACGWRIVSGFGAPGSGPKGQDVGMIVIVAAGVCLSALGNAFAGALILRAQRPEWDDWFRLRPVVGHGLVVLASVPVGLVQLIATTVVLGVLAAAVSAFKR